MSQRSNQQQASRLRGNAPDLSSGFLPDSGRGHRQQEPAQQDFIAIDSVDKMRPLGGKVVEFTQGSGYMSYFGRVRPLATEQSGGSLVITVDLAVIGTSSTTHHFEYSDQTLPERFRVREVSEADLRERGLVLR